MTTIRSHLQPVTRAPFQNTGKYTILCYIFWYSRYNLDFLGVKHYLLTSEWQVCEALLVLELFALLAFHVSNLLLLARYFLSKHARTLFMSTHQQLENFRLQ